MCVSDAIPLPRSFWSAITLLFTISFAGCPMYKLPFGLSALALLNVGHKVLPGADYLFRVDPVYPKSCIFLVFCVCKD